MEERSYGLVIRVVDYSETSKIVSFFTPDFGLLQTIAKGAKRDKNPFQHALDLLSYGELLFVPKKKGLNLLTHFYLEERFSRFRESLEAYCGGCYILEGLRYSLRENQESSLFFSQSLSILEEINEGYSINQGILFFQIHLLDFLGVFPNIFSCHLCGVQIPHGNLHQFHLAESGLLCSSCSGKSSPSSSSHAPSLRREDLKILQRIVQMEREKKKTLSLAPKVLTRLVSFLHPILSYQLERPFHSWLYLQEFSLRTSLT